VENPAQKFVFEKAEMGVPFRITLYAANEQTAKACGMLETERNQPTRVCAATSGFSTRMLGMAKGTSTAPMLSSEGASCLGSGAKSAPMVGATVGATVAVLAGFTQSTSAGVVLIVFFVVYQQIENHFIQPVVYGRTVQLPAFAVFLAVLVGATLAGVIGALAAIPVASAIQILIRHHLRYRRRQVGGRVL